jgi:RNA polymerase sigma-70 factor (ECF subfamily)
MHRRIEDREGDGRTVGKEAVPESVLEDVRLVRRARRDPRAVEEIIGRLAPRVRQTVWLLAGGSGEVEDLAQICLLTILESLDKFRGTGPLEAWAGQLTYRVLMRALKRQRRSERTVTLVAEDTGVAPGDPERETERLGLNRALGRLMLKLPEKRREVLVLRVLYGYSVAEVAELTGTPMNTVRDRIRVGLKDLRQAMVRDEEAMDLLGRNRRGRIQ